MITLAFVRGLERTVVPQTGLNTFADCLVGGEIIFYELKAVVTDFQKGDVQSGFQDLAKALHGMLTEFYVCFSK